MRAIKTILSYKSHVTSYLQAFGHTVSDIRVQNHAMSFADHLNLVLAAVISLLEPFLSRLSPKVDIFK